MPPATSSTVAVLARRIHHAGRMGECSVKRAATVEEVAGGIGDPFLETDVVVPESLSADLVLLADLDTRLLQDLQPWVGESLSDTHSLLGFVDQKVGNEMFGLSGDVLPEFKVEID